MRRIASKPSNSHASIFIIYCHSTELFFLLSTQEASVTKPLTLVHSITQMNNTLSSFNGQNRCLGSKLLSLYQSQNILGLYNLSYRTTERCRPDKHISSKNILNTFLYHSSPLYRLTFKIQR